MIFKYPLIWSLYYDIIQIYEQVAYNVIGHWASGSSANFFVPSNSTTNMPSNIPNPAIQQEK